MDNVLLPGVIKIPTEKYNSHHRNSWRNGCCISGRRSSIIKGAKEVTSKLGVERRMLMMIQTVMQLLPPSKTLSVFTTRWGTYYKSSSICLERFESILHSDIGMTKVFWSVVTTSSYTWSKATVNFMS